MINHTEIYQIIKSDFCELFNYKIRGTTLEVMTSVSTITDRYVSVFISQKENQYFVSDGSWVHSGMYSDYFLDENLEYDENMLESVENQYVRFYGIEKLTRGKSIFCYKKTDNIDMLSSVVYDVAYYIANIINTQAVLINQKEKDEKTLFRKDVDKFLRKNFSDIRIQSPLQDKRVPIKVKFNAIIPVASKTNLIMYVSGSNPSYFNRDLCRGASHFEMIKQYLAKADHLKKIAIINDQSEGFTGIHDDYFDYLNKTTTQPPILYYQQQEQVVELLRKN